MRDISDRATKDERQKMDNASLLALAPPPSVYPERLELAVQSRALHADEFSRAGNVAPEPADLSDQVFALEHLAGVAQRQPHEMFAAVAAGHGGNHGTHVLRQHVGVDHRLRIAAGEDHEPLHVV